MNIAVLCGGISAERDVSMASGSQVALALRERGHNVVLIDVFFGYPGDYANPAEIFSRNEAIAPHSVSDTEPDLESIRVSRIQANNSLIGDNVLEICRAADITFLALHGDMGENGKLQATFDIMGIPYTGSGQIGSALSMNKMLSKLIFENSGIKTPSGITIYKGNTPYENVGFPCVVKPCSGGSSVGTSIVSDEAGFSAALEFAFAYDDAVVVEQYIKGRELSVGVLGGKAMPVIELIPDEGFYDYKNKYQGSTQEICPADIGDAATERVQRLSERVHAALMIDCYSRIDIIMDEAGEAYVLEANTLPGMTPFSLVPQMGAAMGMSLGELCEKIIEISLEKYK